MFDAIQPVGPFWAFPFQILKSCSFKIHFNIMLSSAPNSEIVCSL
jgi:hypothetical protein